MAQVTLHLPDELSTFLSASGITSIGLLSPDPARRFRGAAVFEELKDPETPAEVRA